jgi:hypothetical protein
VGEAVGVGVGIGVGVSVGIGVGVGVGEGVTVNVITACEGPYSLLPNQSILRVCVPSESAAVSVPASTKLPEDAEHVPAGLITHDPPAA